MLLATISCFVQQDGEYTIILGAPLLMPSTVKAQVMSGAQDIDRDEIIPTIIIEVVTSFIFALLILVVTGKKTIAPDLGTYGVPAICLNLWALGYVGHFTGPSFNPALAISQTIFQYWWFPTNPSNVMWYYLPFYLIGQTIGSVGAGFFYLVYESAFPEREEPKRQYNKVSKETDRHSINY